MKLALVLVLLCACAASAAYAESGDALTMRSDLALTRLAADSPDLLLAQRAIERSWGPSEDSVYKVVEIPDWKSETAAFGLSAAVPGLGQEYAGERTRGLLFAAAEITGWLTHELYRRRGLDLRADASDYAGTPVSAGSKWSFERWAAATGDDPGEIEALYANDREVFFDRIAADPRFLAGWVGGDPAATRKTFSDLRRNSSNRLNTSRFAGAAIWVNHALAAFDAVRAARLHDLPLRQGVDLRVQGRWNHGRPGLVATLERRF